MGNPDSPLAQVPGASSFAAAYESLYRLGDTWEKAAFAISAVQRNNHVIPVVEEIVLDAPFCLLRFSVAPVAADDSGAASPFRYLFVRRWPGITGSCFVTSCKHPCPSTSYM
ncbi:hypothetical protein KAF44_20175 (plasmid) [Cupriavidus necator]|nr:hypothetical protein KAF44_20175 [Cupriavidus necator]